MPDWLAILKAYVDTLETIVGTEGGVALANKLTAARAALLDQITALRMAELDAANMPTDLATIITYTDILDDAINGLTAIKAEVEGLAGAAMRGTDNALLAAGYTAPDNAGIATLLTRITAAVALASSLVTHDTDIKALLATVQADLDNPDQYKAAIAALALEATLGAHDTDIKALLATIAGYIDTEVAAIITSQGRQLDRMVKWSAGKVQVQITAAGATVAMPTITIENLPDGATIVEAHLMFKFRMIENKYAGINNLNGGTVALTSQVFQIQDDGGGAWADGINFVDNFFTLADAAREGGDVIVGEPNVGVANVVDGNDTYNVRLFLGKADFDFINFDDCQVGLDILYSV